MLVVVVEKVILVQEDLDLHLVMVVEVEDDRV